MRAILPHAVWPADTLSNGDLDAGSDRPPRAMFRELLLAVKAIISLQVVGGHRARYPRAMFGGAIWGLLDVRALFLAGAAVLCLLSQIPGCG